MLHKLLAASFLLLLAAGCPPAGEPAIPEPPNGGAAEQPVKPPAKKPPVKPAGTPTYGTVLKVAVAGAPELSGSFWPGDAVCLPPACKVTITAGGTTGEWRLAGEDTWRKAGGTFTRDKQSGVGIFTPQLADEGFRLSCTRLVAGAPDSPPGKDLQRVAMSFPLVILQEADVKKDPRRGTWTVTVEGRRMGTWPNPEKAKSWRVRKHKHLFAPPRFWMKITPKNQKLLLAPHVTVGQMVGYVTTKDKKKPKRRHTSWFPPNRHLVWKLEMLSRELLAGKVRLKRLAINSGFRTPYYNRRVGGGGYSRHIYGDAADVMIDEDGDEVCDDITGDGKADEKDGLVIGRALRKLEAARLVRVGGIGVYGFDGPESCRSYVHFDARGYVTRWGTLRKRGRRRTLEWWPPAEYKEDEEPPPEFRDPPGKKSKKARK